jgi:hypothetical protein
MPSADIERMLALSCVLELFAVQTPVRTWPFKQLKVNQDLNSWRFATTAPVPSAGSLSFRGVGRSNVPFVTAVQHT